MILIVDYRSQYTMKIYQRLSILGIEADVIMASAAFSESTLNGVTGVILSGGPVSIVDSVIGGADYPRVPKVIRQSKLPILGICYGMQTLVDDYFGELKKYAQYGASLVRLIKKDKLFTEIPNIFRGWMSHEDGIDHIWEPSMEVLAETASGDIAAVKVVGEPRYGVLWHPEVNDSEFGDRLLKNFAVNICGLKQNLGHEDDVESLIRNIRNRVGKDRVLLALSGGVDSAVTAVLLNKAIGDQLYCVFVDHGFHRENEPEELIKQFELLGLQVEHVMARKSFLGKLIGVTDAEKKRQVIGDHFLDVFETVVESLQNESEFIDVAKFKYLAQGTIASDVIESQNIKSHHNTIIREEFGLELLEPLRKMFKPEVRELGKYLGLPTSVIWKQPCPGPGLAIRVLGEVTKEKLRIVRKADLVLREEIENASVSQYLRLWQWFLALLPVKVTGVKGDVRSYEYPVVLRLVRSKDAMTATAATDIDPRLLGKITTRIVNEVEGVNRVFLDLTDKPSATIEFE